MKSLNEYGKNDLEYLSHGQDGSAALADKIGITVGGYYGTAGHTLDPGDFGRMQLDSSGNLMVNIAAGEEINIGTLSLGTITEVTSITEVANLASGTVAEVTEVSNLAAGTLTEIVKSKDIATGLGTIVIPTSDTVQSGTLANTWEGLVRSVTVVTPALEGTGTATVTLVDSLGGNLISQAQNEGGTVNYGTLVPMTDTGMEWVVTANGTQSADATVTIAVHYEK